MKVGIMQPYFFPYLGYWQLIHAVDKYVVYDDVTFIKGGWINRNKILLNGKAHLLTLPLHNASSFKTIHETEITSNEKARQKVIKALIAAYRRAPYYEAVMPMIEKLIMESATISELNYNAIKYTAKYIGIDTDIILSSEMDKDHSLKGQDKVIHMNHVLGADMYINAAGGRELYSADAFKRHGLELRFLEMGNIQYQQYENAFVAGLSIIDVLMFNSAGKVYEFLGKFTLSGE